VLDLRKGSAFPHNTCEASTDMVLTNQLHLEGEVTGEATPEARLPEASLLPEGDATPEASLFQPKGEAIPA